MNVETEIYRLAREIADEFGLAVKIGSKPIADPKPIGIEYESDNGNQKGDSFESASFRKLSDWSIHIRKGGGNLAETEFHYFVHNIPLFIGRFACQTDAPQTDFVCTVQRDYTNPVTPSLINYCGPDFEGFFYDVFGKTVRGVSGPVDGIHLGFDITNVDMGTIRKIVKEEVRKGL